MGLFFGRKKQAATNQIGNEALKNSLKQRALAQLEPGVDYAQEAYTTCDFGYLFAVDALVTDALLKVVTDRTTIYFSVKNDQLTRQKYNEEMYKNTVKAFLSLH